MSSRPSSAPGIELRVEGANRLEEGATLAFEFPRGDGTDEGFILRHGGVLRGYVNRCPHWGLRLDMGTRRFYVAKVDRIACRNHGALFRADDGVCAKGDCERQELERLELRVEGDDALVILPAGPGIQPGKSPGAWPEF